MHMNPASFFLSLVLWLSFLFRVQLSVPPALQLIFCECVRWIAKSSSHSFCSRPLLPLDNDKTVQRGHALRGNTEEHNVFEVIHSRYSSSSACRVFTEILMSSKYVLCIGRTWGCVGVCVCVDLSPLYMLQQLLHTCLGYSMVQCLT